MTGNGGQWTNAEWAAQCRSQNPKALAQLAEWFVEELYNAVAARSFWDGRTQTQDVGDALQDLFAALLVSPEKLLRSFDPGRMPLEEYLVRRARRRLEALRRQALCRRRHEAGVPFDAPRDQRRVETGVEDRAELLIPRLTTEQRTFLQSVLQRSFSDELRALNPDALRQIVHRIHSKACEQDTEEAMRMNGGKSKKI
jgi:hypothetical protein